MGPDKHAMELARLLIDKFKLKVDVYAFAYAIQEWAEALPDEVGS